MKKLLLFTMAFGFIFSSFAQNQYVSKELQKRKINGTEQSVKKNLPAPILNQDKSLNELIERIYVGRAVNQRGVRREDTHVISYHQELDVISITFAANPDDYDNITEAGQLTMFYSEDKGQNWIGPVLIAENFSEEFYNYYPSGVIYNPAGNTDVANAYGVSQSTNINWNYSVFGKNTLGATDLDTYFFEDSDNSHNGYWNQFGLNQVGNELRCMNVYVEGDWSKFTVIELQPIVAEFNDGEFDFDLSTTVDLDLSIDVDGEVNWAGKYSGNDSGADMYWSNDGEIGYMYIVSTTEDENTGMQPIIVKTIDGGDSWDYIEVDFLSGNPQDVLFPHLKNAAGTDMVIPYFNEVDGAVDYHGDLQLFAAIGSQSADVVIYPDSLGYTWTYPGDLFSITINDDGVSDIFWIDSLNFRNVPQDDALSYNGTGWQHRLSVAKNKFENEFFLTWTDSRYTDEDSELNMNPDIFGFSINFHTGDMSETKCITEGSLYEKFYFFPCGADRAMYDEDTHVYTIPYMNGVSPNDFSTNTSATTDPVDYDYVTGIEFPALGAYVAVNELENINNFSVTQNIPNPFNGSTRITVTTETSANVMIEVSNIMGQTIYTSSEGRINGSKEITLNAKNMEAGVYFYTVTVGNNKTTKKMIVK